MLALQSQRDRFLIPMLLSYGHIGPVQRLSLSGLEVLASVPVLELSVVRTAATTGWVFDAERLLAHHSGKGVQVCPGKAPWALRLKWRNIFSSQYGTAMAERRDQPHHDASPALHSPGDQVAEAKS